MLTRSLVLPYRCAISVSFKCRVSNFDHRRILPPILTSRLDGTTVGMLATGAVVAAVIGAFAIGVTWYVTGCNERPPFL